MSQRQLLGYSLVLIFLGMGWSFTQPMSKLAVSEGYQHFGLIFLAGRYRGGPVGGC